MTSNTPARTPRPGARGARAAPLRQAHFAGLDGARLGRRSTITFTPRTPQTAVEGTQPAPTPSDSPPTASCTPGNERDGKGTKKSQARGRRQMPWVTAGSEWARARPDRGLPRARTNGHLTFTPRTLPASRSRHRERSAKSRRARAMPTNSGFPENCGRVLTNLA